MATGLISLLLRYFLLLTAATTLHTLWTYLCVCACVRACVCVCPISFLTIAQVLICDTRIVALVLQCDYMTLPGLSFSTRGGT